MKKERSVIPWNLGTKEIIQGIKQLEQAFLNAQTLGDRAFVYTAVVQFAQSLQKSSQQLADMLYKHALDELLAKGK
jgi:hypothetical protein